MKKRFYLDTSIWIDYFEDRGDGIKPLGEFAFHFLRKCREHNCKLIYSEPSLFELRTRSKQLAEDIESSFKDLLVWVPASKEQLNEAIEIAEKSAVPFNDAYHAVIARDSCATMVTRDRHFEALRDIVESKAPEEITFD